MPKTEPSSSLRLQHILEQGDLSRLSESIVAKIRTGTMTLLKLVNGPCEAAYVIRYPSKRRVYVVNRLGSQVVALSEKDAGPSEEVIP